MKIAKPVVGALCLLLAACAPKPVAPPPAGQVDQARLQAADSEPGNWLASGRDQGKTHYSPLQDINRETVGKLGFAWEYQTGTNRGLQATPIVVDGVMYISGVAGRVYALDAATGAAKWTFEPKQDLRNVRGAFACDLDLGGARVAVVDDVMTTGATLGELAKVLKRAGAARVENWIVARTLE